MKRKQLRMKGKRVLPALAAAVMLTAEIAAAAGVAFITKPVTAWAENDGKVLVLGTGSIVAGDRIVYGKKADDLEGYTSGNGMYRVLHASEDNAGGDNAMFVLSDNLWGNGGTYGNVHFDNEIPFSNEYQGSDAQTWCSNFAQAAFGERGAEGTPERNAIRQISKNDAAENIFSINWGAGNGILSGDEVFFLSAREVCDYVGDPVGGNLVAEYNSNPGYWWLRSPYADDSRRGGASLAAAL